MGDDGFGGPAGPGPSEGADTGEGDYGGAFGGMAGITGVDGSMSDLGSALSQMGLQTDLTDLGLEGFDDSGLASIIGSVPSFTTEDSFLQDLSKSKLAQALLGFAPTPVAAALSSNPAGKLGQAGLAMGLSSLGLGPFGGLAAAGIMGLTGMGNALGQAGNVSSFQGNSGSNGMNDMLGGLAGIYAGYQGQKDAGNMLGSLQSLYSQNSPYAQAMRQQLQRKDAASGRRSQYGPREVELQAKLAQMASGQIGNMTNLSRQQAIARNAMLQQGVGLFGKLGGFNALKDLFFPGAYASAGQSLLDSGNLSGMFGSNAGMTGGMGGFGELPMDVGYDVDIPWGG